MIGSPVFRWPHKYTLAYPAIDLGERRLHKNIDIWSQPLGNFYKKSLLKAELSHPEQTQKYPPLTEDSLIMPD